MELINKIFDNKFAVPVTVGILGVSCGFGCGYILGHKKGGKKAIEDFLEAVMCDYVGRTSEHISEETLTELRKEIIEIENEIAEDISEPEGLVYEVEPDLEPTSSEITDYQNIIHASGYSHDENDDKIDPEAEEEPELIERNAFTMSYQNDIDWDYDEEEAKRQANPDHPYVIHKDEYDRNDNAYKQETLTYYAADDILADQDNTPIYNYRTLVGELVFGHGSLSPDIVYMRNAAVRYEWEVILHSGSFSQEVHGLELEAQYEEQDLKHSNIQKFRMED